MRIAARAQPLGQVDHTVLKDAVLALDESIWNEDDLTKSQPERTDVNTIALIFCNGWQPMRVEQKRGWAHLNEQAMPLVNSLVEQHFTAGGQFLRLMVAKLVVGGRIWPHFDKHPSFAISHRVHVPLQTNEGVEFIVDEQRVLMQEGKAYELNNLLPHSVYNGGDQDRIHLVFDYMDPQ